MSWARIDDGFHDHPKVDQLSLAAVGLWTLSLTWAHRHRRTATKPGHISTERVRKVGGKRALSLANELVSARLWDVDNDAGGWTIHDFADYLPRERDPEERRAAGQKGAANRWQGHSKPDGKQHGKPNGKRNGKLLSTSMANDMASDSSRASARAFPTRPVNDEVLKGEERNETSDAENATATPPPNELDEQLNPLDARCSRHRGVADPPPCAGCRNARERAEAKAARTADKARREREAVIKRCPDCHGTGWRENPDTALPAGRCDHPSLANAS